MPLYDLKCEKCEEVEERFIHSGDLEELQICRMCSGPMYRLISKPAVHAFKSYQSPITDEVIDSPSKEREHLKRNGCSILEPGMKKAADATKAANYEKQMKTVRDVALKTTNEMFG